MENLNAEAVIKGLECCASINSRCEECPIDEKKKDDYEMCIHMLSAETFYNAGYRKASEVAREIFAEIEKEIRSSIEAIYTTKDDEEDGWYDGELNVLGILGNYFAELKKKFTESEKNDG